MVLLVYMACDYIFIVIYLVGGLGSLASTIFYPNAIYMLSNDSDAVNVLPSSTLLWMISVFRSLD